ncbi:hypothetical protein [Acidovorax sp.]|uniref:hypothetical protein n=1 Tax=Acidovorax sp. TaxID=1872122 RepID=UPI00391F6E93
MTTFSSLDDAITHGFVLAAEREYQAYRDCRIFGFDSSGRGLKGLAFGLRVEVPEELTSNYMGVRSEKSFGESVEVKIVGWSGIDKGGARRPGSGARPVQMFSPRVYADAVLAAKEWTDKWFRAHPEAISRLNERRLEERKAAQPSA